ncbi:MAG: WecB/TagA/CpsF family glycosyltransferase [Hyphomicrobiaceae bacterium]
MEILGVPVSAVDARSAVDTISDWIGARRRGAPDARYICACDVHNVMRAQTDSNHMRALRRADMILADGVPLVWVSRLRGESGVGRVPGPDLLSAVCERSIKEGWSHNFYGGAEGVAGKLGERLAARYPGLDIAGTDCPPFRPMSNAEVERDIARINESGADVVWVGLGCPKQEIWMLENAARLEGRIVIGVGAAFDFHSGRVVRAPLWMREHGLEWLHRLMSEPRRLWRRYLVLAPKFVAMSLAETAGLARKRAREQLARG